MSKKQKIILIVSILIIVVITLGFNQIRVAQAQANGPSTLTNAADAPTNALESIGVAIVYPIILGISNVMARIGGVLYTLASALIDLALRLNALVLKSPMVNTGWDIVLSFANLGFVLAIIVIAIATILRVQQYGAKNLLGKLIAAALLVNFSLMIAGVFMDSANVFTNFFTKQFGSANLSMKLAALIQPQTLSDPLSSGSQMDWVEKYSRGVLKLLDMSSPALKLLGLSAEKMAWGNVKDLGPGNLLTIIASFFFQILFTFLSVLVLLAIGIMLFTRYVYLGILLIISPIVWLFWIFPATSNLWGQWWKHFLRWTFFAPIMMFFLFLAISLMGTAPLSQPANQDALQFAQQFQAKQQGLPIDLMKFGNMVVVLGLLLGGLIAANSMGIHGSKAFMGMAQGAGKWARGTIRGLPGLAARTGTGQQITQTMQNAGLKGGRIARTISAPIRGFGNIMAKEGTGRAAQTIAKTKKDLEGLTNDQKALRARGAMGPVAQAAFVEDAVKEGYLDKLPAHLQGENAINVLKRAGRDSSAVTRVRPDWDPEIQKDLKNNDLPAAQLKLQNKLQDMKAEKWGDLQIEAMLKDQRLESIIGESFLNAGTITPDGLGKAYGSLKGTERRKLDDKIKASIDKLREKTGQTQEKWLEENKPDLYKWYVSNPAINLAVSWKKKGEGKWKKKGEGKDESQPKIISASKYGPVK